MESLDPLLVRAIRLLHSPSKHSTEQLKCMLEEVLAQRKVCLKAPIRVDSKVKPLAESSASVKPVIEKRPFDRTKVKAESAECPVAEKKMKLVPEGRSRSLSSSPDPSSKPVVVPVATATTGHRVEQEDSEATDIEEEGGDEESFSLDMDGMGAFGDLHCVVCKTILNKPGNQLVECQECHSLYHQSCHKPPATDPDVLDPRTIWFCSSCTKNMRKSSVKSSSSTKPSTTASSAFQVAVNIGKESALQLVRERSMKQPETPTTPTAQPFRRAEAAKPGTGPGAVTAKPIGLAGLAANLNHKSSASTVSGSSSSSSSTSTAQVAAGAAADRRLQIMRKKAAKANEKKRSGSK